MANAIVVLDRDPIRRRTFIDRARARIAPVPGLAVSDLEGDGWAAVWAAGSSAPVSTEVDGCAGALVLGDALDDAGRKLSASDLRRAWAADPTRSWDGFHFAVDIQGPGRLAAGVDIMGLLPCFHWQGPEVVLVGTSVDLFLAHPAFGSALDPAGLVGIMLMNGQIGGRTLWNGVSRLGVRRRLRVRDWKTSEAAGFSLPETDRSLLGMPIEGHVELLAEAMDDAVRRHAGPGEAHGLMLSGGLDSRQLGGFLVDNGLPTTALTFGLGSDIEMRCAVKVARSLGIGHRTAEIPSTAFPAAAEALMKTEGLAAGFCNVLEWGMLPFLEGLPGRLALGHVFDGVVGGIHIPWAFDPRTGRYDFDTVFRRFNRWGFSAQALRELLPPELHVEIDGVMESVRDIYTSSSDDPNLQSWHFDLQTRQRFHVGSAVWPMSFRSWPTSPIFDRRLFSLCASMPASSISGRRLQTELLFARHPALAAISLDRNSFDSLPIRPTLGDRVRAGLRNRWRRILHRTPFPSLRREERFYYRTYDFDGPGWLEIRRMVETRRDRIPALLDRSAVDRHLPGPQERLRTEDGIIDSSNAKLLAGLALAGERYGF